MFEKIRILVLEGGRVYLDESRGKCRFTWLNPEKNAALLGIGFRELFLCSQQRSCGFEHLFEC